LFIKKTGSRRGYLTYYDNTKLKTVMVDREQKKKNLAKIVFVTYITQAFISLWKNW
jgi:hypothetical protein